jgi:hypothetical protein
VTGVGDSKLRVEVENPPSSEKSDSSSERSPTPSSATTASNTTCDFEPLQLSSRLEYVFLNDCCTAEDLKLMISEDFLTFKIHSVI